MLKTSEEYGYVIKNGILAFQKGPFSQWFGAYKNQESDFKWNGVTYNCTEQFMMASKAKLFGDMEIYQKILGTDSPREQKELGRKVEGYDQEIWDKNKLSIVSAGNMFKFSQNIELLQFLLDTEDLILVEAAPWDKVWGVGTGPEDGSTFDPDRWKGENLLGKSLMEARTFCSAIKGIVLSSDV